MTEQEIKDQLQTAQDMIDAAIKQRDVAQAECIRLYAGLRAAERKADDLRRQLDELKVDEVPVPKANGHTDYSDPAAQAQC
jgi:hypothetical protein